MYKEIARLVVYRNLEKDNLLLPLAQICQDFDGGNYQREALVARIYTEIHKLLDVATKYGFNENLWQNYLTYLLISTENPFSITCEKVGACTGTVNEFAQSDCAIFQKLFKYDFTRLENALGINCFSVIQNYHSVAKKETRYNKNISDKVRALSRKLAEAEDSNSFYRLVTDFYRAYGVGKLGLNKAFRIVGTGEAAELVPISNTSKLVFDDLIGYQWQKEELLANTRAFIAGRHANNVLLFGDMGTGKSSSIKALISQFYDAGLRMIEIYKHQFRELSTIVAQIKNRNYRFIIYMDDLSFEEFETDYKYLKAIIEGGLEIQPDNILIYATSNRRHLINETWKDREDVTNEGGVHRSDNLQEKLSLASRFGCRIYFGQPTPQEYLKIVDELARRQGVTLDTNELHREAQRWELRHGGLSGRTAQQFINYLLGQQEN